MFQEGVRFPSRTFPPAMPPAHLGRPCPAHHQPAASLSEDTGRRLGYLTATSSGLREHCPVAAPDQASARHATSMLIRTLHGLHSPTCKARPHFGVPQQKHSKYIKSRALVESLERTYTGLFVTFLARQSRAINASSSPSSLLSDAPAA